MKKSTSKKTLGSLVGGIAISLTVLLGACSSIPSAMFDYDRENSFRNYETFSWISEHPLAFHQLDSHVSPILEKRLVDITRPLLERRGLRFVENVNSADLTVAFTIGTREEVRWNQYSSGAISGDYWGYYWSGSSVENWTYYEGQVCVDIFDAKAKRPIWHGTVTDSIRGDIEDFSTKDLRNVLEAIIAGYPPDPEDVVR